MKISQRPASAGWATRQPRYYDFNVWSTAKRTEKLKYIHRNPVVRGLVERPEDWPWSTYRHYAFREEGVVEIASWWTIRKKEPTQATPA